MLSIREVQQTVKKIISNQQIEILSNLGDINKLNLSYNLKKGSKVEVLIADLSKNQIQLGTIINDKLLFAYPFSSLFNELQATNLINQLKQNHKELYKHINKDKKGQGGEKARVSGRDFEIALADKLNTPGIFRDKIVEQLLSEMPKLKDPLNWSFKFSALTRKNFEAYGGKKTPAKVDIIVDVDNVITKKHFTLGMSIKKTDDRTQVHITSVKRFFELLDKIFQIKAPEGIIASFMKFCGVAGYTPSELIKDSAKREKLVQSERERFLLNELELSEQKELLKWLNNHHSQILELVLSKGAVIDPKFHATHYVCYNGHYESGDDITHISVYNIKNLIKEAIKTPVSFSKEFGCLCFGARVQGQMKGSGQTRTQKTNLQFQKSQLNKLIH